MPPRIVTLISILCTLLLTFLGLIILSQSQPAQAIVASPPTRPQTIAFTQAISTTASTPEESSRVIEPPTYIKGLYMTYGAAGHEGLRTHAYNLIDTTELNAVVIDIKGDKGLLTYKSDAPLATTIGANDAPTIRDWPAFMQDLKARNIYAIARIVVFKDNYLARAHPEWAVKTDAGELWLDREGLPWLEAFHEGVWDYNIALAVEAAQRGFDEIQFDYVRFPTDGRLSNIVYSQPIDDPAVRKAAINGFLAKADQALEPYGVKLAVDVFGYTTWHRGDFRIGQDLSEMAAHLDVLSPMLYPSTYDHGLDGMPQYQFAIEYPYEIVYESMVRAISRVKATNPDIIVRPWIQDFPDYGFDRRTYTPDEVREQMFASYDSGGGGWMLWDPRVKYTPAALVTDEVRYPPNPQGELMVLRYETFGDNDEGLQRSLAGFRQDLEQLHAAGYYPINLRDVAVGNPKYRQDLEWLLQNGWSPFASEELLNRRFNYIPAGKRPIVLTFDGSHISQYRLLEDGALDPNSAVGVLKAFHDEHPADWPLRATFFVQPEAGNPAYLLFGQPQFAPQKLQNIVEWGMELGSYTLNGVDLSHSNHEEIRRQLSSQNLIEAYAPGYQVVSLALPQGQRPQFESLLRRGIYDTLIYEYGLVATNGDRPILSPLSGDFDPYHISRINATTEAVQTWLELYRNTPDLYYVSAGVIPDTRPVK
jgi:hypothetical protein